MSTGKDGDKRLLPRFIARRPVIAHRRDAGHSPRHARFPPRPNPPPPALSGAASTRRSRRSSADSGCARSSHKLVVQSSPPPADIRTATPARDPATHAPLRETHRSRRKLRRPACERSFPKALDDNSHRAPRGPTARGRECRETSVAPPRRTAPKKTAIGGRSGKTYHKT